MERREASPSTFWVVADTGATTLISILAMLVMARLIGPEQFGSAALSIGFIQLLNHYVEGLLHDALIRNRAIAVEAFNEAFWLVTGIGLLITMICGVGWLVLRQTEVAPLALLTFVASASLPFSGMTGICNARLRREMEYRIVAAPSVSAKLCSSLIGLGTAAMGFGAWCLIAQFVSGAIIQSSGLLLASGWRPRLTFTIASLRILWRFALPYAVMQTIVYLRIQGFVALTAAFSGLAAAGYVNIAFRLTLTPQILLATALSNLGLPLLARELHDKAALETAFRRFSMLTAMALPVAFFGIAVCADPIVRVVLGLRWLPSILPIQILSTGSAFYFLRMPSALLLRALGHVRYSLLNAIMHLVLTLGAMLVLQPRSPVIASLLWVAPLLALMPLTLYVVQRETQLSPIAQVRIIVGPCVCTIGMMTIILMIRPLLRGLPDVMVLATSVATGMGAYFMFTLITNAEMRTLARRRVRLFSSQASREH